MPSMFFKAATLVYNFKAIKSIEHFVGGTEDSKSRVQKIKLFIKKFGILDERVLH